MAQFANITITKAGLNMIAQSQAGETLIFTKAKLGDGQVGDTNIQELTDIISAKLTAELTSVTAAEEGHVVIKFVVDNSSLETGFFVRELGIYAKVGEGGAEQLYGYTNAGNYTNWLSDKSIPIDAITTQIDLVVGNADEVAFISDKTLVYVTAQDLEDHNTSDAAHENRFSLFQKIATLGDEIVKKLALTTTITVITALQTNSWFGQLLKMVLNASGVKYSMAQNGYICLGEFFGGLIVQWGMQEGYVYLPISATVLIAVVCNRQDSGEYADADNYSQTGVGQYANAINTWSWYQPVDGSPHSINWIAICR